MAASEAAVSSHKIDGHSIATLVIFLLVNILVVFPLHIPLPRILTNAVTSFLRSLRILDGPPSASAEGDEVEGGPAKERVSFTLGLNSAPLLAVLILLASQSIHGETVRMGIVGVEGGVRPYDIMLLFISLAYLSISLDATGLLRYLAFLVSQKGGSSGKKLYLSFYLFFFAFGMFVGNDPIILSGTGFLVYFTRVTGVSHTSWIFAQFAAANIASTILVSSNPTNLILSSSFALPFTTYTAWVILPSIAAAVAAFPVLLFWEYRTDVPKTMEEVDVEPGRALVDPWGAIIGSCLLAVTLAVLVGGSAGGILGGVWEVTVPAALVMLIRDIWHDLHERQRGKRVRPGPEGEMPPGMMRRRSSVVAPATSEGGEPIEMDPVGTKREDDVTEVDLADQRPKLLADDSAASVPVAGKSSTAALVSATNGSAVTATERPVLSNRRPSQASTAAVRAAMVGSSSTAPARKRRTLPSLMESLSDRFPTPSQTFKHLPFPLLPFAFSMFILVDGLAATGWSAVFAGWWTAWVKATGLVGVIYGMGVLSVILCNVVGTNIGCCLLLTSILQTWNTESAPSKRHLTGAIYALALGSNLGAVSFTFPSSLAGLLWRRILSQKGIRVGQREFASRNWKVLAVTVVVGCAVLVGEVAVMIPA